MNLHEFQAKQLFRQYGIPVPAGALASSPDEAAASADTLGGEAWMLKAQIHSGGRGKAGGVVRCDSREALREAAQRLLGQSLVTVQTGPEGLPVRRLLIERPVVGQRSLYLALLIDRARARVLAMAAAEGGMDIEAVAAASPDAVLRAFVHPAVGLQAWQCRRFGFGLGLDAPARRQLEELMLAAYRLFVDCDAGLIEINPLLIDDNGNLIALDAKIELDDNALFRHPELVRLRDPAQEDLREAAAREHGLSYISLDGNIGCMVNGAGLAMATMDLVQRHGGAPANFLDVGGNTTAARVAEAFKLILSDPKVAAVLVNIFGGIVRCDLIAEGILQAAREVALNVPLVVRLAGTNAGQGLAALAASGLSLHTAADLAEAADLVVAAARGSMEGA